MIFTINDQISLPVELFSDTIHKQENGAVRSLTVSVESEALNNVDDLAMAVEAERFHLTLFNGDKLMWESASFTKLNYAYEVSKDGDNEIHEVVSLNFTIE